MADNEVKIKLTAEDRFTKSVEKQIKLLDRMAKKAQEFAKKSKVLDKIPVSVKDKASKILEAVKGKMNTLKNGVDAVVRAKDKASKVLGGIKSKLGGLISMAAKGLTVAVTVVGAGALSAIKDGMQLENQTISMEHFIGVNNEDKSQAQIKGMTDDYIKYLRNNAKKTPFTTEEVMGAGTRMIGVAGGDVSKAQKYLELAEDMAALTPGKTVMDAAEALADMEMGEMERSDFGLAA